MESKTIETKFDSKALPRWAQNDANVVELCRIDLAFRVNVHNADTNQAREMCKREAARRNSIEPKTIYEYGEGDDIWYSDGSHE